jgi:hypothetical protein
MWPLHFSVDLHFIGDVVSGTIEIRGTQSHGGGCTLSMQGAAMQWAG